MCRASPLGDLGFDRGRGSPGGLWAEEGNPTQVLMGALWPLQGGQTMGGGDSSCPER